MSNPSLQSPQPPTQSEAAPSEVTLSAKLANSFNHVLSQLPEAEKRPSQWEMASRVLHAVETNQSVIIEAGTGSGKSLAYLIPALLSPSRPVVISTGTIALQEQLLYKDIPFVLEATGRKDCRVKLVKGRRNYLCIQKLDEFQRTLRPSAPERLYTKYLNGELQQGWDGDRANLDLEIPPEIWAEVESDSEDCLNQRCQYFQDNPYREARDGVNKADILVVNHALYLQDIVTGQGVLPAHQVLIVDEAHQFRQYALKAFTERIGKFATQKLIRKVHRRLTPVPDAVQRLIVETEASLLRWLFRAEKSTFKLVPDMDFLNLVEDQMTALTDLRQWVGAVDIRQLPIIESDEQAQRVSMQRKKLIDQLDGLITRWDYFTVEWPDDRINWVEVQPSKLYFELKSTPLDLGELLNEKLWTDKTAILTSATLATNRRLSPVRVHLGMDVESGLNDAILESPFSYETQCQLYLPTDMPDPNDPLYWPAVVDQVKQLITKSKGRAFVLFTSYEAMKKVCTSVIPEITFPVKMQGDMPKNRLIDWFKSTEGSVLFATATFWEGVDIPGPSLSCVIIDRIPFQSPDDPLHQATVERMKRLGQDWFNDYVLPEAAIRLKQGFGRLIRTATDTGVVAMLDPRLTNKGYGKKLLASLPKCERVTDISKLKFASGKAVKSNS